jgi:hypothetical protein
MKPAVRSEARMSLKHCGPFNATSTQEGDDLVNEKAVHRTGIPIQMDRYLDGRSTLQHG